MLPQGRNICHVPAPRPRLASTCELSPRWDPPPKKLWHRGHFHEASAVGGTPSERANTLERMPAMVRKAPGQSVIQRRLMGWLLSSPAYWVPATAQLGSIWWN